MTGKDNSGPAFPQPHPYQDGNGNWHYAEGPGMTLRDWFAGQVLATWAQEEIRICRERHLEFSHEAVAQYAYASADAMLEASK